MFFVVSIALLFFFLFFFLCVKGEILLPKKKVKGEILPRNEFYFSALTISLINMLHPRTL